MARESVTKAAVRPRIAAKDSLLHLKEKKA